jgi:hypothetical protein
LYVRYNGSTITQTTLTIGRTYFVNLELFFFFCLFKHGFPLLCQRAQSKEGKKGPIQKKEKKRKKKRAQSKEVKKEKKKRSIHVEPRQNHRYK